MSPMQPGPWWRRSPIASLLIASTALLAGDLPAQAKPVVPDPKVLVPVDVWSEQERAVHALNRLAFGPSPADLASIRELGLQRWIQRQLAPGSIPDDAVEQKLSGFRTLSMSIAELEAEYPPPNRKKGREKLRERCERIRVETGDAAGERMDESAPATRAEAPAKPGEKRSGDALPKHIQQELIAAKLIRATESRRQLQEVLTDFWFNHFNVANNKGAVRWMVAAYERDAIRPHVFGTFRELLGAVAHHPAMLFYLDNWTSVREGLKVNELPKEERGQLKRFGGRQLGLNENYARELLELHTLGVDGGYTQQDVKEVARAFTGWSILDPRQEGVFLYRAAAHDDGAKVILGTKFDGSGGKDEGERVLDLLASHPSTAKFIARKLCRKLVSDDPPKKLVERVAQRFLETDGHLPSVYATIISSREFWSDAARMSKTKTPLELAISAIRTLGGSTNGDMALARAIANMGEPLYAAPAPTGHPETADRWVNAGSLVNRINFGIALANGRVRGTAAPVEPLLPAPRLDDPDAVIDALAAHIVRRPLAKSTRETIRKALAAREDERPMDGERKPVDARKVAGLLLGSPEFQLQ